MLISLTKQRNEFVVIAHDKGLRTRAHCIWYVDTFRVLTQTVQLEHARKLYRHYKDQGYRCVGIAE